MKIADFQLVDDLDFNKNLEPSVPAALRAGLQSFGITPTEKTATSIESAKFDAETASRSPRPEHVPMPVNAGNYIIRIRDLKRSFLNAVALACSLEDDTPKWLEAEAEADRIQADLDTLRDEIIAGVNRALSERSEMSQVHLFAVWIELIEALSPGYLSDASHHFAITPVFRQLKTEGTSWAETFVEDATRWNAKNGGANV